MPRSVNCHLALLLCLLVAGEWFSLAQGQVLKPEVLVLPVKFAGVGDANAREILQQYVLTELSGSYELKSEREVAAARERAVDKLASSDCTEEACLKVMGELLDVDYTFAVSVTASGDFWDLTGVRLEPLGRTVRKNVSCERCTLPKAKARLTELLLGLRPGAVGLGKGEAVLIIESEPSGQVFVQGRPQGSTPIEVTVSTRDPVDILIVAEGYTDFAKVYDALRPGERIHETVRLVRKRGRVGLASQPSGANIRLDGELLRDESGNLQTTPLELRLEYGEHTVIVSKERYENARRAFTVEKPDHGKIELTLKPLPGRLVVRVPSKYRNARVLVDGSDIGGMSGEIAKTFEVEAETRLRVQARQGNANSETETVWLEADGSQTVSFENFTEMTPPRSRASEKELEWLEG
ncbi:MAG: PEGA domain-containing protein, partial [SAR324 cluster bacterium]|nr:PEGA domain-containing protein [SAR324 cluster bacterium]